ncbi:MULTISPECIES: ABC transporter ATP-binding protein [Chelativorans]|jgi:oligopeptide/dipeptide ABC transporter ATP-binding protein|uniref:Oligopeptide/dipeptide ABC transporter, ATPase subunit n=1 Tax=Chelativorans sp. (strain BNC1) TaxID=266779 RepID=Q11F13_CHESB|nr:MULTISPECIES: ABC transporter ATP-binding protein [Chelativorans]
MHNPLLSIKDVRLSVRGNGEHEILCGVDLNLPRGKILGLVGESGSGKSSLANCITGLVADTLAIEGSIKVDGVELLPIDEERMRLMLGDQIAMIFQDPLTSLNPVLTIGVQLRDVARRRYPDMPEKAITDMIVEALSKVGLPDPVQKLTAYPGQFSGGMRQRVVIAMALLVKPSLLIADEPTTALDATIEAQVVQLLADLRSEFTGSIIFISHHLGVVSQLCDDVCVMYAGSIVEYGPKRDVLFNSTHPYTQALIACEVDDAPEGTPLKFIPGAAPRIDDAKEGCRFAPRCSFCVEACRTALPPLLEVAPGHFTRCIRAEEIRNG